MRINNNKNIRIVFEKDSGDDLISVTNYLINKGISHTVEILDHSRSVITILNLNIKMSEDEIIFLPMTLIRVFIALSSRQGRLSEIHYDLGSYGFYDSGRVFKRDDY